MELKVILVFFFLLALMRGLAIHFRPRQMPSQFSWTLSKTMLRLWVLLPNTIPSYPSPLPLPIIHLRCFMVTVYEQHHQIKTKILPFSHRDPPLSFRLPTPSKSIFLKKIGFIGSMTRRTGTPPLLPKQNNNPRMATCFFTNDLDYAPHNSACKSENPSTPFSSF
jgi:hypothetical protein